MLSQSRYILKLLTPKERRHLAYIFIAIMITAVLEVAGVASIMPFMSLVVNPSIITESHYLQKVYQVCGFDDYQSFLIAAGITVMVLIALSNCFSALTQWCLLRFSWMRNHSISRRVLSVYLSKPYTYFINSRIADLHKNILNEVYAVIQNILMPSLIVLSRSIVAIAIISLLLLLDPVLSLSIALALGLMYLTIYLCIRNRLQRLGKGVVNANAARFRILEKAFGGIKFIKLAGRERNILDEYSTASRSYSENNTGLYILAHIPRYAMEAIAFSGIITIILYLMVVKNSMQQAISFIAVYAFAGYRLMPLLQQIFAGVTQIHGHTESLTVLKNDIGDGGDESAVRQRPDYAEDASSLKGEIILQGVGFAYNQNPNIISNLNLKIDAYQTVGLVGETGAGKSTVAGIIMGLLPCSKGKLIVDGAEIDDQNICKWQRRIGYVPQSIYLANDTIYANIAFGIAHDDVDAEAVHKAMALANLSEWVESLPRGIHTHIGDRGIRISGGQRQKIAIARALYGDPALLVLDEATSSMDSITENIIIDAINRIKGKKTIITIAHRLTTVKDSDAIYVLDKGKVIAHGTYNQLMESSDKFRMLTNNDKESTE